MERGIATASYVGSPLIYQIDRVENSRGCNYAGSVASIGKLVFYLSDDGFYAFDGQKSNAIGAEKVNKWFFDNFDSAHIDKMSAAIDPTNQIVAWSFVSNDATSTTPDRILIYNYACRQMVIC
jgi:hypothetical protein